MRYLYIVLILLTFTNYADGSAAAASKPSQSKREKVLQTFKKAIELDKEYENSVSLEEKSRKRDIAQEVIDNELDKAFEDCIKLLSSGNDEKLAISFFNLLISFENSADETLDYTIGEIFLNNPNLIVKTFAKFNKRERRYLYSRLEWGWENIIVYKKLRKEKFPAHLEKLKRLNPGIDLPKTGE